MTLTIDIQNQAYMTYGFISYLQQFIFEAFHDKVNPEKFVWIDVVLNTQYSGKTDTVLSAYSICTYALTHLKLQSGSGAYYLSINNTLKVPNTSINLLEACQLITYGVLGVQGYPIIIELFDYVETNFFYIYDKYQGLF